LESARADSGCALLIATNAHRPNGFVSGRTRRTPPHCIEQRKTSSFGRLASQSTSQSRLSTGSAIISDGEVFERVVRPFKRLTAEMH
jgi:hypothetical protein